MDARSAGDYIHSNAIRISADGYVRLVPKRFAQLTLVHLHSGMDDDKPLSAEDGAVQSSITGYTEWVTTTKPTISVCWDWQMTATKGQVEIVALGFPRSNLMFVDKVGNDLGQLTTESILRSWVHSFEWQSAVHKTLAS